MKLLYDWHTEPLCYTWYCTSHFNWVSLALCCRFSLCLHCRRRRKEPNWIHILLRSGINFNHHSAPQGVETRRVTLCQPVCSVSGSLPAKEQVKCCMSNMPHCCSSSALCVSSSFGLLFGFLLVKPVPPSPPSCSHWLLQFVMPAYAADSWFQ